jgi:exopolysaccharide biosynthesis protein
MSLKKSKLRTVFRIMSIMMISVIASGLLFLYAPFTEKWRYLAADTLITTQHRHWAKYIIGSDGLAKRLAQYQAQFKAMDEVKDNRVFGPQLDTTTSISKKREVVLETIETAKFSGYLLYVSDPKQVKLVVPSKVGRGEQVSAMVKRTGAIAGVNAGGFVAPNMRGNGFVPIGLVMSGGKIFFNNGNTKTPQSIVGIDKYGKMVAGKYTIDELSKMEVQDAVTFSPRFIVNGKGLIKNQSEGYGLAPRTAMAQLADGTIVFIIVDGRKASSIGASLYDVQEILLEKGAVIAANLDGGASSIIVHNNEILNTPSGDKERYIPTAFLVYENPEEIIISNIWEGLDIENIDASKW